MGSGGLRLSTRRLEKDPLKAKKLVADAAYQRFLETVKKQQELEVKSQQQVGGLSPTLESLNTRREYSCCAPQYDMDVISFDRDLVNSVYTRAEKKIELKTSLDAQVADERRRKQQGGVGTSNPAACGCMTIVSTCFRARGSTGASRPYVRQYLTHYGPQEIQ